MDQKDIKHVPFHRMINSVERGELDEVRELVQTHGISSIKDYGYKLICAAIKYRHIEVTKFLLEKGVKIKSIYNKNDTALHHAASAGSVDIVEALLERGAQINVRDKGRTPLFLAICYNHENIVRLLVELGASIFSLYYSGSLLHKASGWLDYFNIQYDFVIDEISGLFDRSELPFWERENENIVRLLLDKGAHLESKNDSGRTPLHCAVESNRQDVVKLLLTREANVNARSKDGSSPLHLALRKGYETIARLLLEYGADINAPNRDNKSPLCLAVEEGFSQLVSLMLEKHNPNVSDKLPLKAAVCGQDEVDTEINNILIAHGYTFDLEDATDLALLKDAVKNGRFEIAECLIKHETHSNYDMQNIRDCTLLCYAITSDHEKMVNLLLSRGADPNAKCPKCRVTPITSSVAKGNASILRLLLANQAIIQDKAHLIEKYAEDANLYRLLDAYSDQILEGNIIFPCDLVCEDASTPLHIAVRAGNEEIVSILLQQGHDINATTAILKLSPLHYAICGQHKKIVKTLLANGANVNAVGQGGLTPLHIAVHEGYLELVKTLLVNGANVDLNFKADITPLHIAAGTREYHPDITRCLLQAGHDPNSQDNQGDTALHIAIRECNLEIVPILLTKGADVNITNRCKETSLDVALKVRNSMGIRYGILGESSELNLNRVLIHIKLHIIKLEIAGLCVSEKNQHQVSDLIHQNGNNEAEDLESPDSYKLYQNFREEVEKMKNVILDAHLSLHDILTTDNPRYILNETLMRALESFDYDRFPHYGDLLRSKFETDCRRSPLIESSIKPFTMLMQMIGRVILPKHIVEMILCQLEIRELKNLIASI